MTKERDDMLSPKALALLAQMFDTTKGQITFPAGFAREVVEIEEWVKAQGKEA
jgi:hypothetical protein